MIFVPDTHALVWYVTADKRIGKQAQAALASVDKGTNQALVPVVVLTEIMYLEEKRRVAIKLDELVENLRANENYSIAPLTLDTLFAAKRLAEIPELFDRAIAATALVHNAILVTRDPIFQNLKTIW